MRRRTGGKSRTRPAAALAGVATACCLLAVASAQGQQLAPGLALPVKAGKFQVKKAPRVEPSRKRVDGKPGDWRGRRTRIAGSLVRSAGELIYEDFLFDSHGADDGGDAALSLVERLAVNLVPQLDRPLNQAPRFAALVANSQLGGDQVPFQTGDAKPPKGRNEAADLTEARIASAGRHLYVLARTGQMRTSREAAALLLIDLDRAANGPRRRVPFGSGLHTRKAELAVLFSVAGAWVADLRNGLIRRSGRAAVRARGYTNAIEGRVPLGRSARKVDVAFATGYANDDATGFLKVGPGATPNVVNVAFRREPVSVSMDDAQGLMLGRGSIDATFTPIDRRALERGQSEIAVPAPGGYYEAHFVTRTPGVSRENIPKQGRLQHYALYVPKAWRPGRRVPTTLWLHYGLGTTHQLGAFQPNLVRQLGERRHNLIVGPSGRGVQNFYGGSGYSDVFEALGDSDRFGRDPDRTYIAGYSMGSYGTMMLTALHPDLWAGALGADGSPPSYFDGMSQNTANSAAVPFVLMGGLAYTQMRADYEALRKAGGTARMYLYPVEHYSNIVLDEWAELSRALGRRARDRRPERVRYTRVPAIEKAVSKGRVGGDALIVENRASVPVEADGAFWVDRIKLRGGNPSKLETTGTVDAVTHGFGHREMARVPESRAGAEGAVLPYVMEGVRYEPRGPRSARRNAFRAVLTNVRRVRFDLRRMGLRAREPLTAKVTTDGPVTIHLDRGRERNVMVLRLRSAGMHTLNLKPTVSGSRVRP